MKPAVERVGAEQANTGPRAQGSARLPGPKASFVDRLLYWPGRDPLGFFTGLQRTHGDVASYKMGGEQIVLVSDPHLIKDVLVTHSRNFRKGRGLERSKRLLGEGLLTSEGDTHAQHRRLMTPAFHSERIAQYGRTMVEYAGRVCGGWADGSTLDIAKEMNRLTLSIGGRTLFGLDVESQASEIGAALTDIVESFWTAMLPLI